DVAGGFAVVGTVAEGCTDGVGPVETVGVGTGGIVALVVAGALAVVVLVAVEGSFFETSGLITSAIRNSTHAAMATPTRIPSFCVRSGTTAIPAGGDTLFSRATGGAGLGSISLSTGATGVTSPPGLTGSS